MSVGLIIWGLCVIAAIVAIETTLERRRMQHSIMLVRDSPRVDSETGLLLQSSFHTHCDGELRRVRRSGGRVCLLLVRSTDNIVELGRALAESVRHGEAGFRFGDELVAVVGTCLTPALEAEFQQFVSGELEPWSGSISSQATWLDATEERSPGVLLEYAIATIAGSGQA